MKSVTCVYNNTVDSNKGLVSGYGLSMLLEQNNSRILIDTGLSGKKLMHNMKRLGIDPEKIDSLFLSHAHRDHTGGIKKLLKARKDTYPLKVYLHPEALNKKALKSGPAKIPLGMPRLSKKLLSGTEFIESENPETIFEGTFTTGEISTRPEKQGLADNILHRKNGKFVQDPIRDDMSLVTECSGGAAIICGCCHAGILNTCAHVKNQFNLPVKKIIGGTHLGLFSKDDIRNTVLVLQNEYDSPELYLNHCTGQRQIDYIKSIYQNIVMNFPAGMTIRI